MESGTGRGQEANQVSSGSPNVSSVAPQLFFSANERQELTYVNALADSSLGYEPGEVLKHPLLDYVHPDDHDKARHLWCQLACDQATARQQFRIRHRDGHYVPFLVETMPRLYWDGRFGGVDGIVYPAMADGLVERTRGSLLKQMAGLREVGESLGSMSDLSRVLESLAAYPVRQGADACWIGLLEDGALRPHPAALSGADGARLAASAQSAASSPDAHTPLARAMATRQAVVEELDGAAGPHGPLVDEARARGYRSMAFVPMVYGDEPLGVICAYSRQEHAFRGWRLEVYDLFAQIAAAAVANTQALQLAQRSEARFRELVDGLPCVVYVARTSWPPTLLFVSSNIEQFTGYKPDDFYADMSLALRCIHPDERERAIQQVRSSMARPEPYTMECRVLHRNGRDVYHAAARSTPFQTSDGEVRLRRGIIVDVTQQRQLEHELLQSQRLAAIGEMAAMMAHEIRNPLAGMSLALRMLRDAKGDGALERECRRDLEHCVQRINATVSRVLDFSKARPLMPRPCRLDEVVASVQRLTATYMRKSHVQLHTELPDDLPELRADPDQLEQVFVNLILNACKAMPDGGQATLRARTEPRRLHVEVADTGIGIEAERLDVIFDPFYTGFGHGTGLGLPLCRRILEAHGGTIAAQSEPGKGSTFHIELPLEPPDAPDPRH